MTPQDFVAKWTAASLKERSSAQEHFLDLCHMLGEPTPAAADPDGSWYCFEKGATKSSGGDGWADVWKAGHFGWEYKGKKQDLKAAFVQLLHYSIALESPPLLVVSDIDTILIHTNFTNTVQEQHRILLEEIGTPDNLRKLRWLFTDPDRLRPGVTTATITEEAAGGFAQLAQRLRDRGHEALRVAHFLNKILFCLFAEDAGLLPKRLFVRLLEAGLKRPAQSEHVMRSLFTAMMHGGTFGADLIEWFNGGLFDNDDTLPLTGDDVTQLLTVARLDWSAIEPSIFGTLFQRGLDPSKRSQLGAQYTDPTTIMRIVTPVVVEPLLAEWAKCKLAITAALQKATAAKTPAGRTRAQKDAEQVYRTFLTRLSTFKVLDPACGSGNFLYLSLQALKDIEHRVTLEAEQLGLQRSFTGMNVGVHCVHGIEINTYAAELARVTVWIGEIQWMLSHGAQPSRNPILKPLDTIECRDALLADDGSEPKWPSANCIVGNPPFLGDKRMIGELGEAYVAGVRKAYQGRVAASADLVTYWFEKARAQILANNASYAGLVATQSIRGGNNRGVLDRITMTLSIYDAWSDEPWVNEGAAVRVSIVCFARAGSVQKLTLNGSPVAEIFADLTARHGGSEAAVNLTLARPLLENSGVAFQGPVKVGAFDIPGTLARAWLLAPNPHGRANSEVLRPWVNGQDLTQRPSGKWIIDFGAARTKEEAALYQEPFTHIERHVRPGREIQRDASRRTRWWLHGRTGEELRTALTRVNRYIATSRVSKHRFFVWLPAIVWPDSRLYAIVRDDDTTFGVLSSRIHEVWSLAKASMHGVGNDPTYNAASCFETFPFPEGLTPSVPSADYGEDTRARRIAQLAKELDRLREAWLNPDQWFDRVREVVPGYPDRLVSKPGFELEAKTRTLTGLYNLRPSWLMNVQHALDRAVAAAYGWDDYSEEVTDEEILNRLLTQNLSRNSLHES